MDDGADRGRAIVQRLAHELRTARIDRGLTQDDVSGATGISRSRESLIERALADVDVVQWSRLLAAVGLELSVQTFPTGSPVRDQAHAALLERLRGRLHRTVRWATEVPMPVPYDLRAWDALTRGAGWAIAVEAETRPRDVQALERRIALKQRDSGMEHAILLLKDSRNNRALARLHSEHLATRVPVPGRRAIELLAAGVFPGGNSLILL